MEAQNAAKFKTQGGSTIAISFEDEKIWFDGTEQDIDDFESSAQFMIEQSSEGKIERVEQ